MENVPRNRERSNFTLSENARKLIEHYALTERHKSMSSFVEFLVLEYDMRSDGIKKLRELAREKEDYNAELEKVRVMEQEVLKRMEVKSATAKVLEEDKEAAIEQVLSAIRRGKTLWEMQTMVKTWAVRLNMTYEELSFAVA